MTQRWGRSSLVMATVIAVGVTVTPAFGNGQFENRSWQFDTPNDKIAKATDLDLREKKEGGYYDSFQVNNNFYTTNVTHIDGDQINCNLTASAVGNSASNDANGQASSPLIDTDGSITSNATGNENSNTLHGEDLTRVGGWHDPDLLPLYDPENPGVFQNGKHSDTTQSNENSPQDSTISNSGVSSSVDGLSIDGGISDVALNSAMSNDGSPQNASVTNSEACQLNGRSQSSHD